MVPDDLARLGPLNRGWPILPPSTVSVQIRQGIWKLLPCKIERNTGAPPVGGGVQDGVVSSCCSLVLVRLFHL